MASVNKSLGNQGAFDRKTTSETFSGEAGDVVISSTSTGKLNDIIYGDTGGKKTQGQLKDLAISNKKTNLVFPTNLESIDHWVAFSISRKWNWMVDELDKKDIFMTIFLPVPSTLQTGYDVNWQSEPLGVIGMGMANSAGDAFRGMADNGFSADSMVNGVTDIVNKIKNTNTAEAKAGAANIALGAAEQNAGTLLGSAVGGIPGAILGQGVDQAIKGIAGAAGLARNPHNAMMFGGVDFRVHSFSYKFVPETEEESQVLREIIARFKYHMSPGYYNTSQFLDYPETFDIDFNHEKYLFNIGNSVLTSFDVNYHGENTPLYHSGQSGKAPVSVTINMKFTETTITTKESILQHAR